MEFIETLKKHGYYPLRASKIETLQVNVGYRCNMSCKHCHVQAGPSRTEMMGQDTIKAVIDILAGSDIRLLDITGGAGVESAPQILNRRSEAPRMLRHGKKQSDYLFRERHGRHAAFLQGPWNSAGSVIAVLPG